MLRGKRERMNKLIRNRLTLDRTTTTVSIEQPFFPFFKKQKIFKNRTREIMKNAFTFTLDKTIVLDYTSTNESNEQYRFPLFTASCNSKIKRQTAVLSECRKCEFLFFIYLGYLLCSKVQTPNSAPQTAKSHHKKLNSNYLGLFFKFF